MSENTKRLEAYFKKYPPPGSRSRLYPYRSLIEEMREMGASLRQICDYMENEEGVKISNQYLSTFIDKIEKTNCRKDLKKSTDNIPKTSSKTTTAVVEKEVVPDENWIPKIKPGFSLFESIV